MDVGIGRLNKDRKVPGRKIAGKIEVGTDASKKSNKSEYGNFLNTSGIMTGHSADSLSFKLNLFHHKNLSYILEDEQLIIKMYVSSVVQLYNTRKGKITIYARTCWHLVLYFHSVHGYKNRCIVSREKTGNTGSLMIP